jgi:serine/threonine protein kinase
MTDPAPETQRLLELAIDPHATTTAGGQRWTPPPPEALRAIPNLEPIALLGSGGMGAVYKARQTHLDRLVALKILPPERAREAGFAERFAREARILARLNHPHIVALYDFGQAGDWPYLVMELVEGATLRQVLQTGKLSAEEALRLVPQLCDALGHAHAAGVVHRDLKPENILIDGAGRPKIADFGLAKLREEVAQGLTASGVVLGSVHYMAPEQVEAAARVDHRADLYALGVILYELLTGALPLGRFAPPSHSSGVDPRLDEVVLKSLEREPDKRWQTAEEVRAAMSGASGTFAPPPPPAAPAAPEDRVALVEVSGIRGAVPVSHAGRFDLTVSGVGNTVTVAANQRIRSLDISGPGNVVRVGVGTTIETGTISGPGSTLRVPEGVSYPISCSGPGSSVRSEAPEAHAGAPGHARPVRGLSRAGMHLLTAGALIGVGLGIDIWPHLQSHQAPPDATRWQLIACAAAPVIAAGGISLLARSLMPVGIIGCIATALVVPWAWAIHWAWGVAAVLAIVAIVHRALDPEQLREHYASCRSRARWLWTMPLIAALLALAAAVGSLVPTATTAPRALPPPPPTPTAAPVLPPPASAPAARAAPAAPPASSAVSSPSVQIP